MRLTLRAGSETARILLVSDDTNLTGELQNELKDSYALCSADSIEQALHFLEDETIDLVITDGLIGGQSGLEIIRIINQSFPATESMLLFTSEGQASQTEAVECGAFDALPRWISGRELRLRVNRAIEHTKIRQELTLLRQQVAMEYGNG